MQQIKSVITAAGIAAILALSPTVQAGSKHGAGGGFGSTAAARHNSGTEFTDYAKVIHSEPVYRRVKHQRPSQQCWQDEHEHTTYNRKRGNKRRQQHQPNPAQAIVGGIVGGVIGNRIGRHAGGQKQRAGATIAGAIIGSAIANEGHRRHRWPRPSHTVTHTVNEGRPSQYCNEVDETYYKRELIGYNVTYRYRGRTHSTRTHRDPGRRLPIHVSIRPRG